jgi:predicted esterase
VIEQSIAARTHGRYLVVPAATHGPAPLLVGFHGYGEAAEAQAERLRAIPGSDAWTIVAVQALHRFYRRRSNDAVVASWMTRQDRELAIADNVAYIESVVTAEWAARFGSRHVVYAGFSQGVAMAFRAAAASAHPVGGVIGVGGDIPPELEQPELGCIGHILICRGVRDEWYTAEKFEQDQRRLQNAVVDFTALQFDGGHEWAADAVMAASQFLANRLV